MFAVGLFGSAACFDAPAARSPWRSWTSLQMHARAAAFFSGRLDMQLANRPAQLQLETRVTARFLGASIARSRTVSILDRATGRTIEHLSLSRKRGRRYVFGEHGYTVEKFNSPGGPDGPRDQWETISTKEFFYPEAVGDEPAPPVFDYYGMLLRLRLEKLNKPDDEAMLYVATSKGVEPYTIRVGEIRAAERTFRDPKSGEKRTLALKEMRLLILPADPDNDEGFLSMQGETELWVEADSKTLLEISGKVPRVPGRVELQLVEMG